MDVLDTMAPAEQPNSAPADEPAKADEVNASRRALVREWESKVVSARKHKPTANAFKQMRNNMRFAARGADDAWIESGKYVVPITSRYINQAVAQLYARNPKAQAKRRERLVNYKLWDERADTLKAALENASLGDPQSMALIQEVLAVRQQDLMIDRMGRTLSVCWEYYLNEQSSNYKQQFKALVRRAKVCKVGWVKLGYQRLLEKRPEVTAQIEDVTSKIAHIKALAEEVAEGEVDDQSPRIEELRLQLADLQSQETILVREGPVLDFPRADEITIDPACRHLKTLTGAKWAAQMYEMTPDEIKEVYGVDVGKTFKAYSERYGDLHDLAGDANDTCKARVHEIWDHRGQQWLTICEGYPDFIKEPAAPDLKIERFWPIFPLVFNEIEHDEEMYPPSDVEQAKHIQNEYNRSRESLREHRIAARPYYVASKRIEEKDLEKLANHAAHEVITMGALSTGEKVEDFIMRGPVANIDPNLYEVEMHWGDFLRTLGTQEATLGGTGGGTATESSIAEQSTAVSKSSDIDDLDELLSDIFKSGSQLMLTELSKETAIEIAGPGAVWPDMPETREQVAKDLWLECVAGSSGRPNRAAELANMERGMPIMTQLPGVNPEPIAKKYLDLLDIDVEEAITAGVPSITALNAILVKQAGGPPGGPGGAPGAQAGAQSTGDAQTDPNQQGPQGAQNAPSTQTNEPGPQPAYPSPKVIG